MAKPEMVSSTSAKSKWYIFTSDSCLERHEPQSLADEEMYHLALWKLLDVKLEISPFRTELQATYKLTGYNYSRTNCGMRIVDPT